MVSIEDGCISIVREKLLNNSRNRGVFDSLVKRFLQSAAAEAVGVARVPTVRTPGTRG